MSSVTLILILFALPVCYLLCAYLYLAVWHRKIWLLNTVMHEDGSHTLWGALTYWGHFLACVPPALFISWCLAGGTLIAAYGNGVVHPGLWKMGLILVALGFLFILVTAWGSVRQNGIQQTLHYAMQKFERDNVSSWGGCWNQFVPSNLVIGCGSVAAGMVMGSSLHLSGVGTSTIQSVSWERWLVLGLAVLWLVLLSVIFISIQKLTSPRPSKSYTDEKG